MVVIFVPQYRRGTNRLGDFFLMIEDRVLKRRWVFVPEPHSLLLPRTKEEQNGCRGKRELHGRRIPNGNRGMGQGERIRKHDGIIEQMCYIVKCWIWI